jgi:beta-galactosidase
MSVSVHHFSTQDLGLARRTCDLHPREEITLNLDYAQSGLGSASCGPGRLEKYQLIPEEVLFRIRLTPLNAQSGSALQVSKRIL